jgi:uncharacterized membrane protein
MDYLLIIVLGIVVLWIWNSNRDAHEQMREAVDRLEREIDYLRSQLAALVKASAKSGQVEGAAAASEAAIAKPAEQQEPLEAQAVAPRVAPFTPPVSEPAAPTVAPPEQPEEPSTERETVPEIPLRPAATLQSTQSPSDGEQVPARPSIFSLEETLGANWLNKLGIAILVIGLAFFLAYKLQSWGPAGKILCGFAVSVTLLGGGVWLERKPTFRIFARAGIGGGWALAYFTTFAMYHLPAARIVDSLPLDLILMLLVAAGMVLHSLCYRSQTVTSLAFLLAFATLLTSHLEQPDQTVVFSLVASAILAIGLVVVTTTRHWAVLELCGLVAVYLSHLVWLSNVLPGDRAAFTEFWPSTFLILLYWLIFRLAYIMRTPLDEREENLSSASAILNSGGVLGLLKFQSAHPEWAFWVLLVLGVFEMGMAYWARAKRRPAFVMLSTIAVVLLVSSVPFRFHGVSWPVLWLVQAQVLAIAGLRLGEPVFRRLGLLTGLITGGVLALHDVMPLAMERLMVPAIGRHWSLTAGLALAALLYWTHAEVYPRRWPGIGANAIERRALRVTSWLGVSAAAAALWVALPGRWAPVGWRVLVVALGLAADWIASLGMALQADVLALVAWFTLVTEWEAGHGDWKYRLPMVAATALFYCGMRRKSFAGSRSYVAAAYSWAAAALLVLLAFDIFRRPWIAPVLAALCIALFEIGRLARKGFLRWQGYALLAVAFTNYFAGDLPSAVSALTSPTTARNFTLVGSNLLEVLILIAGGYWLMERTRESSRTSTTEQVVGLLADAVGTLCMMVWFGVLFPFYVPGGEGWITAIWAAMATVLIALTWIMRRRTFMVQAIALALAAVLRGLLFDLVRESNTDFWHGPLYHLSVAALVLMVALPFAFKLRGPEFQEGASLTPLEPIATTLLHPEQWFFFAPFGMMVAALAAELSSGHITIAWSLLGLGTFLFALAVGERSFRLAGLALLLVSVAKILLMDVWKLEPSDRYTTLIVLGLALLAVSFLYTRFSTTIRKYL